MDRCHRKNVWGELSLSRLNFSKHIMCYCEFTTPWISLIEVELQWSQLNRNSKVLFRVHNHVNIFFSFLKLDNKEKKKYLSFIFSSFCITISKNVTDDNSTHAFLSIITSTLLSKLLYARMDSQQTIETMKWRWTLQNML